MSRGPSPSFPMSNGGPYGSLSLSNGMLPNLPRANNPPRSTLRVNTDPTLTRFRSNSAQSSTPAGSMNHQNGIDGSDKSMIGSSSAHQPSRSLSHAPLSPIYSGGSGSSQGFASSITFDGDRHQVSMGGSSSSLGFTRVSPPTSAAPAMRRILKALENSADDGDTLDLSRQGIDRIGDEEVEMFRRGVGKDQKGVWRLALSYNALRDDSISQSFARLTRLRYLNLKGNHFTSFPSAITEMDSLEILDLSKNAIQAFPDVPGRLVQLKVLSLTNNAIYTLPSYLTTFSHLKVFKVDQNPIEWPPREVLGPLIDHDPKKSTSDGPSSTRLQAAKARKDEDLRPWIENMKSWMRQKKAETERLLDLTRIDTEVKQSSEEEPMSAVSIDSVEDAPWASRIAPLLAATAPEGAVPRSASSTQSFSHRNRSATISEDSLLRPSSPNVYSRSLTSSRHDRSSSVSSVASPFSATGSSAHTKNPSDSSGLPPPPSIPASGHTRGSSYNASQRFSANLTAKKSLPDLRQNHAKIIADRRSGEKQLEGSGSLGLGIDSAGSRLKVMDSDWTMQMAKMPTAGPSDFEDRRLGRKRSEEMLRRKKGGIDMAEKRKNQDEPLVDDSKNSYFRRLSTLPTSTLSKAIPPGLLKFLDAIRGILFALSQIHTALRQYLVFAVNERIAGVFTRVMDPASAYMMNLINALDKFDSMSRRSAPPLHAIRGVIDSTKESIAVFAKVIAVLKLQIPALKGGDVRYTRTLLTMLYGSMAEVACSWKEMAGLMPEIKVLLAPDHSAVRAIMGGQKMVSTGSITGRTPISPIPERGESHSPPSVKKNPPAQAATSSPLRDVEETSMPSPLSGKNRRQGGSFSTEDVEKGMLMGSPGGPRAIESLHHRPNGSAQLMLTETAEYSEDDEEILPPNPPFARNAGAASVPSTPPNVYQPIDMLPSSSQHSRKGHKQHSSSGSSLALSMASAVPAPLRKLSVDVRPPTPSSATLLDDDLLDVVETAIDIAFGVWLKLAEDLGGPLSQYSHNKSSSQGSVSSQQAPFTSTQSRKPPTTIPAKAHQELLNLLSASEQVTSSLRESVMGLRANPHSYNTTTFPDDAQAFIKAVIKVSELVKSISASHAFPSAVRQSLSKLTQATRECAILISVSSLRPGSSTPVPFPPPSARSFSPAPFHAVSPPSTSGHANFGGEGAGMMSMPRGPSSSMEELYAPPQSSQGHASFGPSGWNQREGTRGLQLPSRQLGQGRSRSTNEVPPAPMENGLTKGGGGYHQYVKSTGNAGDAPMSAQPSQIAF